MFVLLRNAFFDNLQRFKFKCGLDRKRLVLRYIDKQKCRDILEIGVFNGHFARRMILAAAKHSVPDRINYVGVDLFESNFSNEIKLREVALTPNSKDDVGEFLRDTGANIELYEGFSNEVLPALSDQHKFDLIVIDGGHSYETVKSDFFDTLRLLKDGGCIIFDDYTNLRGEIHGKFGINKVIRNLPSGEFRVNIGVNRDFFWKEYGLLVLRMVMVKRIKR